MILDTVSEILYRPSRGTIRKYTTLVELSRYNTGSHKVRGRQALLALICGTVRVL
jgi:hypothetical protein